MRAYRVSGSAELFPQHCQIPNLSNIAHLKALTKELTTTTSIAAKMHKGYTFIHKLKIAIDNLLTADGGSEQRVGANSMTVPPEVAPVGQPIKQIIKAPPIMKSRDSDTHTSKKNKALHTWCSTCNHKRHTSSNLPGNAGYNAEIDKSKHTDSGPHDKFHALAYNYPSISIP